jgi:hypothetical protein
MVFLEMKVDRASFRRRLTRASGLSRGDCRGGRRQNESRTRQAIRGIKQMFREDGLA